MDGWCSSGVPLDTTAKLCKWSQLTKWREIKEQRKKPCNITITSELTSYPSNLLCYTSRCLHDWLWFARERARARPRGSPSGNQLCQGPHLSLPPFFNNNKESFWEIEKLILRALLDITRITLGFFGGGNHTKQLHQLNQLSLFCFSRNGFWSPKPQWEGSISGTPIEGFAKKLFREGVDARSCVEQISHRFENNFGSFFRGSRKQKSVKTL